MIADDRYRSRGSSINKYTIEDIVSKCPARVNRECHEWDNKMRQPVSTWVGARELCRVGRVPNSTITPQSR